MLSSLPPCCLQRQRPAHLDLHGQPPGALLPSRCLAALPPPLLPPPCATTALQHRPSNHLSLACPAPPWLQGVWEKDEIRKDDSFLSFEEVFEVAAANNADFVLLGGDLFHDNKPSRNTIVRPAGGSAACGTAVVGE